MLGVSDEIDLQIRLKAFEHLTHLTKYDRALHHTELNKGFIFKDGRIPFLYPRRGILKPQKMKYLLSIRTSIPRPGRENYDDQWEVYEKLNQGEEILDYAFMKNDPESAPNKHLLRACENNIPIIYFIATEEGFYLAVFPVYVVDWIPEKLKAKVNIGVQKSHPLIPKSVVDIPFISPLEKKYAFRTVKVRVHQERFRSAVMKAYDNRCAVSGFPETSGKDSLHKGSLIDVAHIIADSKQDILSKPEIGNGIPLTKLHHAAFDANLIGIDPDYRLHVSKTLWNIKDGQTLEMLKSIQDNKLRLPRNRFNHPDPARLEIKFREFENIVR